MTKTTGKMTEEITSKAYAAMATDCDVSHVATHITSHLARLLSACEVSEKEDGEGRDEYTVHLVDAYIGFVAAPSCEVYGSNADYCSMNAMTGIGGYKVRLTETAEADEILHEIRVGIHATALNPWREFGVLSRAGIPISRKKFLVRG